MHCERAQEFFSDYLERTLDRPMTVALDAHMAACASCREEVDALQAMFRSLDAVPEITPPWDGAQQVIQRLREELPEPMVAPRPIRMPQPRLQWGLLPWLRSFSPASVAMGAGLATFAIAGTFLIPGVPNVVKNTIFALPGTTSAVTPTAGAEAPAVSVSYGEPTDAGQPISLHILSATALPDAEVTGTGGGRRFAVTDLSPQRPVNIDLVLPYNEGDAHSVWLDVASRSSNRKHSYLVVVPVRKAANNQVPLVLENQPIELALRSLAPALGQPVVVVDRVGERVSINAPDPLPAIRSLENIAADAQVRVSNENGSYRLSPAQ